MKVKPETVAKFKAAWESADADGKAGERSQQALDAISGDIVDQFLAEVDGWKVVSLNELADIRIGSEIRITSPHGDGSVIDGRLIWNNGMHSLSAGIGTISLPAMAERKWKIEVR